MHISFIPYGKRESVERLLRDMEAQKHFLRMEKDGVEKGIYIDGQVRVCPFGVYEYVFPKEAKDAVLSTLDFDKKVPYGLGAKIKLLRSLLRYKKAPEFTTEKKYLWVRENVSLIPIGIREDGEVTGSREVDMGWKHEAI